MQRILFIGLAGLAGTIGRYLLSALVARRFGDSFPAGTLAVNVAGCFLAGLLFYFLMERKLANPMMQAVVMVGFLGGFTTFSAFGLQTFALLREGRIWFATLNLVGSNVLGLLMVWAGYAVAKLV